MPDLRLQVDGVNSLLHKMSRVLAAQTRATPMEALVARLTRRLQNYPPATGGDYVRTGELGRGWASQGAVQADASGTNQFADRVSVNLRNQVSYAGWVQGPEQAWMHQGRWETTEHAVDAETGQFVAELSDSIGEAWGQG